VISIQVVTKKGGKNEKYSKTIKYYGEAAMKRTLEGTLVLESPGGPQEAFVLQVLIYLPSQVY
jgi:hypothetical protein